MTASDFRPGAQVVGSNGKNYTVIETHDDTITVTKTLCTIEDENGNKLTVSKDELTPFGKHAAQHALLVGGKTLIIGSKATFIIDNNTRVTGELRNIYEHDVSVQTDYGLISFGIDSIIGVSLVT